MKKLILLSLCSYVGALLHAQVFHFDFGLSILRLKQEGTLYGVIPGHNPIMYTNAEKVDRSFTRIGLHAHFFYPINFGTYAYEKIGIGPEAGVILNLGSAKMSTTQEPVGAPTLRIPIFFSAKVGCANGQHDADFGAGLSLGVEYLYTAWADERSHFITPKIRTHFALRNFELGFNFYALPVKSHQRVNEIRKIRLSNRIFEIQLSCRLVHVPPRYKKRYDPPREKRY